MRLPAEYGDMLPPDAVVTVRRGNIYLPRELCETHFHDIDSVALLVREGQVLIVPLLRTSPGGLLLKVRNARGDRVIQGQEFLRGLGVREDFSERSYPVRWRSDIAALEIVSVNKVCN